MSILNIEFLVDEQSIFELENRDENENLQIQNDEQIEIFNLNLTICWFEHNFKFKNWRNKKLILQKSSKKI